jgi:hypothetical protein
MKTRSLRRRSQREHKKTLTELADAFRYEGYDIRMAGDHFHVLVPIASLSVFLSLERQVLTFHSLLNLTKDADANEMLGLINQLNAKANSTRFYQIEQEPAALRATLGYYWPESTLRPTVACEVLEFFTAELWCASQIAMERGLLISPPNQ